MTGFQDPRKEKIIANPLHHSISSSRKWGGEPSDYMAIHQWFDESKAHFGDFRHRALRHHTEGIFLMETIFGFTLTLSTCARCGLVEESIFHDPDFRPTVEEGHAHAYVAKVVPTRWVGEQHVIEDLGKLVTVQDWLSCMTPQPWMNRSRRLSAELEREEATA